MYVRTYTYGNIHIYMYYICDIPIWESPSSSDEESMNPLSRNAQNKARHPMNQRILLRNLWFEAEAASSGRAAAVRDGVPLVEGYAVER